MVDHKIYLLSFEPDFAEYHVRRDSSVLKIVNFSGE